MGGTEVLRATAVGFVLLMAVMVWLINKPPVTPCPAEPKVDSKAHEIRAMKVVVQPWKGPHQVYGIFMVPIRYKDDRLYSTRLRVQGFERGLTRPEPEYMDTMAAKPGYYLKRTYAPTRLALWFLVSGMFGDLRTPCHWTLVIMERRS
jgi:hypothetical protein